MDQKSLVIKIRNANKKGGARRLRRAGQVPSVIYGRNDPVLVSIDEHEFSTKFKTVSESKIITLNSEDSSYDVLVKDYQEDIVKGRILHIDFFEIEKGKVLRARVPIHLDGAPIGVREGGLMESLIHELEIECLPKDLPEEIRIDVSELGVSQSVHVSEIGAMEGIKFLTPNDQVVCTITTKREVEEEVEEEEEIEGEEEMEEVQEQEE